MTGQNLVTPDDLGKRVTFQFDLPNGFRGEAVGIFERWDHEAETYLVARRTAPRCACRPAASDTER